MIINVREAKLSDDAAIGKLQPRNSRETIKAGLERDRRESVLGNTKRLVIEIDGAVVGQAIFERLSKLTRGHRVRVTDVVVAEEYRGLKLCTRLFEAGENWVQSLPGVNILELTVRGGIEAEEIYRHLGFLEFGRLIGGIKESWEGGLIYDEVFMFKKV
ncbi:hypothetical protein A3K29_00100 [Candidatus Collierbacteria bacterium RIFOXYB2_FULL_46_14]|uniref:N-acetyltransferase domain-containing protein n=1 Tax=Candidatus Collierbacteria bacterium GW2011_GWA2_46_26 TaxID=1618381 RepID=A0A0G1PI51_9BACT|nr:MAG: hypothetical protein UW29_C0012G0002 [Candidatus Collierbacteria bacterium GW2011_GWC2_44_13]KKU32441.1 MAG: hypothetical protein UX47_C0011G0002 [Candidatus Collierbacteria bacterium GW2011_GWA2_46_26]OGD72541.1 MAG: hypothetical protein A3K29_00100 [Candidatus Collierbacteria bacterium RIFOXYB2_FULL_46_14]OGD75583.1 MAG: hypothetical protein A3K43_00100 [Candidatus Collierbacteria bacterium RIFOXYA2_FULL_46_20]OGD76919.1 MAG: hypothetical protein A3K39_00100 [Candidatus Collierbacteri